MFTGSNTSEFILTLDNKLYSVKLSCNFQNTWNLKKGRFEEEKKGQRRNYS